MGVVLGLREKKDKLGSQQLWRLCEKIGKYVDLAVKVGKALRSKFDQ